MTETKLRQLVDIGANLTHDSFNHDRDEVMRCAHDAGVAQFVLTGTTVAASEAAASLALNYPTIAYSTAGVHPHHASELDSAGLSTLRQLAQQEQVVALGECGLDYFRDFSPRADQQRAFRGQLELACELGLPVFLHQRDAHDDFFAIVSEYRDQLGDAIAHCFTGNAEQAVQYLELGLFIGITGWICDERRGGQLREAVRQIPANRLMIETDSPYLLPRDLKPRPKSRRNEPRYLPHVLEALARYSGHDVDDLAQQTTSNARAFFKLAVPQPPPTQA